MLATLGVLVAEATTGVAWQDAGKVELDGASYLGQPLPFSVTCDLQSLCPIRYAAACLTSKVLKRSHMPTAACAVKSRFWPVPIMQD